MQLARLWHHFKLMASCLSTCFSTRERAALAHYAQCRVQMTTGAQINASILTAGDFTVLVNGLDSETTNDELSDWASHYGEVSRQPACSYAQNRLLSGVLGTANCRRWGLELTRCLGTCLVSSREPWCGISRVHMLELPMLALMRPAASSFDSWWQPL